ncbi:hypothetical protein [Serratia entomophila]|uniref:hypothetical protein n=1 Tax=Serratia entomophila TaxID=42906 RepID=UPI0021BD1938|nr:hypothetical protein [Serratia entomophila]
MQWKTKSTRWGTGERLLLGSIEVGGVSYDVTVSKSDSGRYAATCSLPGIKKEKTHFQSQEEAKVAVEQAVMEWLKRTGLQAASPEGGK